MAPAIVWASPFLPVVSAFLAYAAVKRRWHPSWFVLWGFLANSTFLWVVALVIAFVYGRQDLFVPFVVAMISSVFTGVFLRIKLDHLIRRMGVQVRLPQFHPRYVLTWTMTLGLFGVLLFFAKMEHADRRSAILMALPLAAIALACYFFERSQYRPRKLDDRGSSQREG